jgi:hypothetical protein
VLQALFGAGQGLRHKQARAKRRELLATLGLCNQATRDAFLLWHSLHATR